MGNPEKDTLRKLRDVLTDIFFKKNQTKKPAKIHFLIPPAPSPALFLLTLHLVAAARQLPSCAERALEKQHTPMCVPC